MRRTVPRILTAILVTALLVGACGDDDDDTSTGDTSTTSTTEETTTTPSTSSTTTDTTEPGDLPGERVDIFPYEDAELAVVGSRPTTCSTSGPVPASTSTS